MHYLKQWLKFILVLVTCHFNAIKLLLFSYFFQCFIYHLKFFSYICLCLIYYYCIISRSEIDLYLVFFLILGEWDTYVKFLFSILLASRKVFERFLLHVLVTFEGWNNFSTLSTCLKKKTKHTCKNSGRKHSKGETVDFGCGLIIHFSHLPSYLNLGKFWNILY